MTSREALGLLVSRVQVGAYKEEIQKCFDIVNEALLQAQKQEKLLGLYRELMAIKNEIISLLIRNEEYGEKETIEIDLEKQIKELENE